jgi:hypothetical protein
MAASSEEAPAPGDPMTVALRAAAVHSAALVLVNAAQHLQRTTVLVEAATVRAMIDAAGGADPGADRGLVIARAALTEAARLVETAQAQARMLAMDPGAP